jgi:GntR family transcriptional regulator
MLTVQLNHPSPIHDQIMTGLRRLIAAEKVRPGEELPTVRQLAADLGVNLNTVARAYRALETDGLVSSVRGRGTVILADREAAGGTGTARKRRISDALSDPLADAKLAGLSRDEARQIVDQLLDVYWPET